MLGVKPSSTNTPMEKNVNLDGDNGLVLSDKRRYWSLVDKLIDLTTTRLDITFLVSIVSQFMEARIKISILANMSIAQFYGHIRKYQWIF